MSRHFSIVCALFFTVLFSPGVANDLHAAPAKAKAKPAVTIEDNMGFVGTAVLFTLNDDGSWTYTRFFPRDKKGTKTGNLSKDDAKVFIEKLDKAGAFDAKAKDIEPRNPQIADGAYFAVMRSDLGKKGRLQFKHGGPTSKAVMVVVDEMMGDAARE